ncbi:MAG: hypothetical protein IT367_11095 [Candidatus Hydrogenedentes bacterium]|nr:hypothetical protein [Candidatus Hydrogenedentota bacterium]
MPAVNAKPFVPVYIGLLCVAALLSAGCGEGGPAKTPPKPGERKITANEIRAQFESALQPIYALVEIASADSVIPPETAADVKTKLEELKKKYAAEDAYKQGIDGVVKKLEDHLRIVRERQNGVLALYLCGVIRFFDPDNSRVVRYEKWGETVKNRPRVTIRGWYEPRDTPTKIIYTFVEVYTPEDGQTHHLEVREGEEFLGLKYVRMIGDKRGILFEYMKTEDRFEVYSKSWLRRL